MKFKLMKALKFVFLFLAVTYVLTGCETYKNVPYFKDISDSANIYINNAPYKKLLIQPDDILNISIQTIDPTSNILFNQNVGSSLIGTGGNNSSGFSNVASGGATNNTQAFGGYLVDKNGEVVLPLIGKIKLTGLSTDEARDSIQSKVSLFYKLPTVYVRFANLKITVLGEVLRPGTYVLPNEKNTIFDALGLAGDLTIFGKRENVLLIRDSSLGKSHAIRFSLNSKEIMNQDFFYLRQNDVIYVEPNKSKIESLDAVKTRNYTILASVLSILIIFATRINN